MAQCAYFFAERSSPLRDSLAADLQRSPVELNHPLSLLPATDPLFYANASRLLKVGHPDPWAAVWQRVLSANSISSPWDSGLNLCYAGKELLHTSVGQAAGGQSPPVLGPTGSGSHTFVTIPAEDSASTSGS